MDNIDNSKVAWANHETLHEFYLRFNKLEQFISYFFAIGITHAGRSALEQSGNGIVDISLKPYYAGICGFTIDDLDSLFADRYEETLNDLIAIEQMKTGSTVSDLRNKIFHWYDGYVFDGETTVDETTSNKPIRV
jgi:hypothetical protein